MNKNIFLIVIALFLPGCATVNFSANYFTPPDNYKDEVKNEWSGLTGKFALKNQYLLKLVSDRECSTPGIPEINGNTVKIPETFIKYIYQNYYDNKFLVLNCIISHELCHTEYSLYNQSTPQAHFQVDKKAIELLQDKNICTAQDYYKSLFVLRNYWFARKGVAGHTFNIGWNVAQVASLVYAGSANFVDWFATDLDKRLALISKAYRVRSGSCFKRYQEAKTLQLSLQ